MGSSPAGPPPHPRNLAQIWSQNGLGHPEIGPAGAQRPVQAVTREAGHRLNWSLSPGWSNFRVSQPILGPNFWLNFWPNSANNPLSGPSTHPSLSPLVPPHQHHPTPPHTPTGEHIRAKLCAAPVSAMACFFVPWVFGNSGLRAI